MYYYWHGKIGVLLFYTTSSKKFHGEIDKKCIFLLVQFLGIADVLKTYEFTNV